ncbi:hypothetical protein BOTBODRAFT_641474 [Botryobasidium botryosum FD-172 SS1]|uniref:Uncharacterized protein n=1 Tax=Botryobasidium botryosum (strain FD-172 SS1) TaxID=930990 RepID=A0A067MS06_BOTB1|nr:hypothetical protein BOTBODRAFT_641474 [Botryobasidium botryosum FD-172 SS1]
MAYQSHPSLYRDVSRSQLQAAGISMPTMHLELDEADVKLRDSDFNASFTQVCGRISVHPTATTWYDGTQLSLVSLVMSVSSLPRAGYPSSDAYQDVKSIDVTPPLSPPSRHKPPVKESFGITASGIQFGSHPPLSTIHPVFCPFIIRLPTRLFSLASERYVEVRASAVFRAKAAANPTSPSDIVEGEEKPYQVNVTQDTTVAELKGPIHRKREADRLLLNFGGKQLDPPVSIEHDACLERMRELAAQTVSDTESFLPIKANPMDPTLLVSKYFASQPEHGCIHILVRRAPSSQQITSNVSNKSLLVAGGNERARSPPAKRARLFRFNSTNRLFEVWSARWGKPAAVTHPSGHSIIAADSLSHYPILIRADYEKIWQYIQGRRSRKERTLGGLVVWGQPGSGRRQLLTLSQPRNFFYDVPIEFLRRLLSNAFAAKPLEEQTAIAAKFMPHPQVAGIFCEPVVVARLLHPLSNSSLDCYPAKGSHFSLPCPLRVSRAAKPFNAKFTAPKCDMLYVPPLRFPSIDAVAITEEGRRVTLLQMTIPQNHGPIPAGVKEIISSLGQAASDVKIALVFVAPPAEVGESLCSKFQDAQIAEAAKTNPASPVIEIDVGWAVIGVYA